jgi:hypothetical protein
MKRFHIPILGSLVLLLSAVMAAAVWAAVGDCASDSTLTTETGNFSCGGVPVHGQYCISTHGCFDCDNNCSNNATCQALGHCWVIYDTLIKTAGCVSVSATSTCKYCKDGKGMVCATGQAFQPVGGNCTTTIPNCTCQLFASSGCNAGS